MINRHTSSAVSLYRSATSQSRVCHILVKAYPYYCCVSQSIDLLEPNLMCNHLSLFLTPAHPHQSFIVNTLIIRYNPLSSFPLTYYSGAMCISRVVSARCYATTAPRRDHTHAAGDRTMNSNNNNSNNNSNSNTRNQSGHNYGGSDTSNNEEGNAKTRGDGPAMPVMTTRLALQMLKLDRIGITNTNIGDFSTSDSNSQDLNRKHVKSYPIIPISTLLSTLKAKDIKKAYIKQTLSCHPDLFPTDPDAKHKFFLLQEAMRVAITAVKQHEGFGSNHTSDDGHKETFLQQLQGALYLHHRTRNSLEKITSHSNHTSPYQEIDEGTSLTSVVTVCQEEQRSMAKLNHFCAELPKTLSGETCVLFDVFALYHSLYVGAMSRCILGFSRDLPLIVRRIVRNRARHMGTLKGWGRVRADVKSSSGDTVHNIHQVRHGVSISGNTYNNKYNNNNSALEIKKQKMFRQASKGLSYNDINTSSDISVPQLSTGVRDRGAHGGIETMPMKPLVLVGALVFQHPNVNTAKTDKDNNNKTCKEGEDGGLYTAMPQRAFGPQTIDDIQCSPELICIISPGDSIDQICNKIGQWEASSYDRLRLELAMAESCKTLSSLLGMVSVPLVIRHQLYCSNEDAILASLTLQRLIMLICGLSTGAISESKKGANGAVQSVASSSDVNDVPLQETSNGALNEEHGDSNEPQYCTVSMDHEQTLGNVNPLEAKAETHESDSYGEEYIHDGELSEEEAEGTLKIILQEISALQATSAVLDAIGSASGINVIWDEVTPFIANRYDGDGTQSDNTGERNDSRGSGLSSAIRENEGRSTAQSVNTKTAEEEKENPEKTVNTASFPETSGNTRKSGMNHMFDNDECCALVTCVEELLNEPLPGPFDGSDVPSTGNNNNEAEAIRRQWEHDTAEEDTRYHKITLQELHFEAMYQRVLNREEQNSRFTNDKNINTKVISEFTMPRSMSISASKPISDTPSKPTPRRAPPNPSPPPEPAPLLKDIQIPDIYYKTDRNSTSSSQSHTRTKHPSSYATSTKGPGKYYYTIDRHHEACDPTVVHHTVSVRLHRNPIRFMRAILLLQREVIRRAEVQRRVVGEIISMRERLHHEEFIPKLKNVSEGTDKDEGKSVNETAGEGCSGVTEEEMDSSDESTSSSKNININNDGNCEATRESSGTPTTGEMGRESNQDSSQGNEGRVSGVYGSPLSTLDLGTALFNMPDMAHPTAQEHMSVFIPKVTEDRARGDTCTNKETDEEDEGIEDMRFMKLCENVDEIIEARSELGMQAEIKQYNESGEVPSSTTPLQSIPYKAHSTHVTDVLDEYDGDGVTIFEGRRIKDNPAATTKSKRMAKVKSVIGGGSGAAWVGPGEGDPLARATQHVATGPVSNTEKYGDTIPFISQQLMKEEEKRGVINAREHQIKMDNARILEAQEAVDRLLGRCSGDSSGNYANEECDRYTSVVDNDMSGSDRAKVLQRQFESTNEYALRERRIAADASPDFTRYHPGSVDSKINHDYIYRASFKNISRTYNMIGTVELAFWREVYANREYLAKVAPTINFWHIYFDIYPNATPVVKNDLGIGSDQSEGGGGGWYSEGVESGTDLIVLTSGVLFPNGPYDDTKRVLPGQGNDTFREWVVDVAEQSALSKEAARTIREHGLQYVIRDPQLPLTQYLSFLRLYAVSSAARSILEGQGINRRSPHQPSKGSIKTNTPHPKSFNNNKGETSGAYIPKMEIDRSNSHSCGNVTPKRVKNTVEDTGFTLVISDHTAICDGGRFYVPWFADPNELVTLLSNYTDENNGLIGGRNGPHLIGEPN